jgi:hypothetical protein
MWRVQKQYKIFRYSPVGCKIRAKLVSSVFDTLTHDYFVVDRSRFLQKRKSVPAMQERFQQLVLRFGLFKIH